MKFHTVLITRALLGFALPALLFLAGCGGSSSTSNAGGNTISTSGNNVAQIAVNAGPPELAPSGAINTAFLSLNVCVPGTSTCQTINNVAVDTGSTGIRILASKLSLSLTPLTTTGGGTVANCNQFVDGYTWGPVETADISIPGTNEKASGIPIQVIDDTSSFTAAPVNCVGTLGSDNNVTGLGAYAILGIGNFRQDCGGSCTLAGNDPNNPGFYYSCSSGNCGVISASIQQQLQNPVAMFATDNNGSIVELPSIDSAGSPSVTGSLVFGIGTQSNNQLGSATVITLDQNSTFTTVYGVAQTSYTGSVIDSGSNGIYFLDPSVDGITTCQSNSSFYCPSSTLNLTATNEGLNGNHSHVNFSVANAESLPSANFAFNDLGGTNFNSSPSSFGTSDSFDFGLPFFFGRNVYTGLEGVNNGNPTDAGQYVAY